MAEFAPRLRELARRLRSQQAKIIAEQNNNSRQKTLRNFSSKEAASLLGITESYLRARVVAGDGFPEGALLGKNRIFTLAEIHAARRWLFENTGNLKYRPGRRDGDKLCVVAT